MTDKLPLSGLRVLDLGRFVAAPVCTQMLADLGADVIKIERPDKGDDLRHYGPPFMQNDKGEDEVSFDYLAFNRNKRSVSVDIATPAGKALIKELASKSHILVENFRAGQMAKLGLGYDDITAVNPDIIYCSISGFGMTGPYRDRPGLDTLFQAMSGLMSITGDLGGRPVKVGTVINDFIAGMYSIIGILAALRHKEMNGGGGQHLDMALLDTAVAAMISRAQIYLGNGEVPGPTGTRTPGNAPVGAFKCKDGEMIISAGADAYFRALCRAIGEEALADDPRFKVRRDRVANEDILAALIDAKMVQKTRSEWMEIFLANDVMCAPINDLEDVFTDPQVLARGMLKEVEYPGVGTIQLLANPIRFSKVTLPPFRAPPKIGQHTDEVLRAILEMSDEEIAELRAKKAV